MAASLMVDIEVIDASAFAEYRKHVPPLIAVHGGKYLVRGGASVPLEGTTPPNRTAVLEFPSMEQLIAFYSSAEYAPLKQLRSDSTRSRVLPGEGM
jgi:uncharacterized protein (DUF1330 family)